MSANVISSQLFSQLIAQAEERQRRRQHHNLHSSYEDPCQRLLNAIAMDSYIRPHRHALDPKAESLIAIRGLFALITFEDGGAVDEVVRFGSEIFCREDPAVAFGVELPPDTWHTVVALAPESVLLELKPGPFDPNGAKELADWAPEEESAEARVYLESLRQLIAERSNLL